MAAMYFSPHFSSLWCFTYCFHHLHVLEVVDYVLENVAIRHETEGAKHDHDGYLLPYVGQSDHDTLPHGSLLAPGPSPRQLAHPQRADRASRVLDVRTYLCGVGILGLLLGEDVDCVCRHLLLRNEDFLRPVDDEIAAGIEGAFVEFCEVAVREVIEEAVGGSEHDGDLPDEGLGVLVYDGVFSLVLDRLGDVNVEWGRVTERGKRGNSSKGQRDRIRKVGAREWRKAKFGAT